MIVLDVISFEHVIRKKKFNVAAAAAATAITRCTFFCVEQSQCIHYNVDVTKSVQKKHLKWSNIHDVAQHFYIWAYLILWHHHVDISSFYDRLMCQMVCLVSSLSLSFYSVLHVSLSLSLRLKTLHLFSFLSHVFASFMINWAFVGCSFFCCYLFLHKQAKTRTGLLNKDLTFFWTLWFYNRNLVKIIVFGPLRSHRQQKPKTT